MFMLPNVPLAGYSTMRLGGEAAYLTEINQVSEISQALNWAKERQLPYIMIGGGSNIIWKDEGFPGLVMVNKILRFEQFQEDEENLYVTVGAGENWDSVVQRTVELGFSGLEFLSSIPGSVGAAPVQNIGAYGHELADVFVSLEAFDTTTGKLINMPAADCGFGYRTSRFKLVDHSKFFITAITCHLIKNKPQPPYYHFLQQYLDNHNITDVTPAVIREAVMAIRAEKLPDPSVIANTGSFFRNPVVDEHTFQSIRERNIKLQNWPTTWFWELPDGQYKIAAGALLEVLDFKGVTDPETGMGTWPKQALVLINQQAKKTSDLLKFKQKIVDAVKNEFGIELIQEPELLP